MAWHAPGIGSRFDVVKECDDENSIDAHGGVRVAEIGG